MLTGGVAMTFDLHIMHHILKAYQYVAAPRPYDNQSIKQFVQQLIIGKTNEIVCWWSRELRTSC